MNDPNLLIPGPRPAHTLVPTKDPQPWLWFNGDRVEDDGVSNLYGSGYRWKPRAEYDDQ